MDISPKRTDWLMVMDNDSLGGREPENKTDNFRHCPLCCNMLNWMMKYDGR